jgi:hypothetical protein
MYRKCTLARIIALALIAGYPMAVSFAQEAADPDERSSAAAENQSNAELDESIEEKTCVLLRSIDRTDVIDDYNILFYMRGPDIYHVRLPFRCPGLRAADSFMYSTSLNVLCDLDTIRPLRNFGGSFTPGAACGMGRFTLISKEEVALMKNKDVEVEAERGEADIEGQVADADDAGNEEAAEQD